LRAWLDQGPLLMDGAKWFRKGHWVRCSRLRPERDPHPRLERLGYALPALVATVRGGRLHGLGRGCIALTLRREFYGTSRSRVAGRPTHSGRLESDRNGRLRRRAVLEEAKRDRRLRRVMA